MFVKLRKMKSFADGVIHSVECHHSSARELLYLFQEEKLLGKFKCIIYLIQSLLYSHIRGKTWSYIARHNKLRISQKQV